ncbi:50S ribosomal protein L6 [Planctomicrobium sp. SH661]|uniref:50S ribosomal protein L6 n=1 Tax=Planctomicrobium sp. SH661 TaxID=3448124 RepID=UPI003F5C8CB9
MSRIGKKPIPVAAGVDISINDGTIKVKGKNGELTQVYHPNMEVTWDGGSRTISVARPDDQRQNRALHGLTRALIANMVQGVQTLFEKRLEIQGVGYQATLQGKTLSLQVGYANIIKLALPEGVICEVPAPTQIIVKGADKHDVGQFAANIRRVRPPEPYKGKGIRYVGEVVRRKAGKAFGS